ncbi:ABC transporter ATP-binding protein [Adhaeribacter pallidiroseus]|uniref:Lipid A export ATP-binding/permease protein MsbA n=1 Tax=Adhaeribacter pallidiroseus TaxID=2072847 RepID=A0A369QD13_9BACT|nr:ABC transporter ATP-binding protein [Adhaeribacter pallidiroseus]RDC61455.1 Lipid A export ATP-binding/permease protein MsbA [Adhaeribacter pallidiroseus]
MKTYFRILHFAKPFLSFVPQYSIFTILGIIFGLFNFTLLIPLLDVLFGTTSINEAQAILQKPAFSLDVEYIKKIFNYFFGQIIVNNGKIAALQFVCILIVISVFLSNLFRYLGLRAEAHVRTKIVRNIRQKVYERITQLQLGYFTNERKGDILSRLSNDVQEIETSVVSTLNVIVREPFTIIGLFIILFTMSARLTLFTMLVIPVSGFIISSITKKLRRTAILGQEALGHILSIIDETLGSVRVIKAFNAQSYILDKFTQQNNRYGQITESMWNKRSLASPISEFMGVASVAGILFYGGNLVLNKTSDLSPSQFITYIILFSQVLVPVKAISTAFSNIQRGLVSGDRVLQIIDTQPQIRDLPTAKTLPGFSDAITFNAVSFAYGNEAVLQQINLTIPKGKTIALVGPSGGGKSTLADLLPRFYDPTSGVITIDGVDIKTCTLHSLREQMGVVTQESILFNDTIFNNIAFNKTNATEAEVIAAAKIANAHEFIMQSPDGYQTTIGDRGGKLSGGQRQRISIARAILKNPPILIMDEATSALDTESEKLVQEALINLMRNRTSLVIAHRLSTIQHADEIIVLQKGSIRERGTHEQLLRQNGLYARLNQMQITTGVISL